MRKSVKSAFALVALLGGLAAVPALSSQDERGSGSMMGPESMMDGNMMPMMGMMRQMSRMMKQCENMMEGAGGRPNDQWRSGDSPAPEQQR